MARSILILGASYGSLLATKLLMAGHHVTLACRETTAALINLEGSQVRIRLRDEPQHRAIFSRDLPGRLDAAAPQDIDIARYDLVVLAMQEPHYADAGVRALMRAIAGAKLPCLSIMNMPPLPYLRRIPALVPLDLGRAYTSAQVWDRFEPALMTLCSPDPQAFRPPEEGPNVLHVGLPTNFKTAPFGDQSANALLRELAADIDAATLDGKPVPVRIKLYESLFVPFAKWAMLMTGNYRSVTPQGSRPIRDAVHGDIALSRSIFEHVNAVVRRLGASDDDLVTFERYAVAAEQLLKPSLAARDLAAGATFVERVDLLIALIARAIDMPHAEFDRTVEVLDRRLNENAAGLVPPALNG